MISLGVVVILALLGGSHAYPQGAPMRASLQQMTNLCSRSEIKPGHGGSEMDRVAFGTRSGTTPISPQLGGNALYELHVSPNTYGPGTDVVVELRAKNSAAQFKGFYIYLTGEDALMGDMGSWKASPTANDAKQTFFCLKGMTHTNGSPKTSVTVRWTPPAQFTHGRIKFKATVVESYSKFYTDIESSYIKANSSVDKQSQHMQKMQQRMMQQVSRNPQLQQLLNTFRQMSSNPQLQRVMSMFGQGGGGIGGGIPNQQSMQAFQSQVLNQLRGIMPGASGQSTGPSNNPPPNSRQANPFSSMFQALQG